MLRRLLITSNMVMISLTRLCAYCKGLHPLRERSYAGVLFPVLTCGATRSHPQHRATTGTYPSCQRWFLPVSAGTYPSGQRCCAASASHSGRTKGGRDCVASAARSAETKGTAQLPYGSGKTKGEGPCKDTPYLSCPATPHHPCPYNTTTPCFVLES